MEAYHFIDLCCGIGGFHQALSKLNMKCVFACDIDSTCREVYERNYGIMPHGDLNDIDIKNIPSFDVLCAGFPCQPFSKAGNQKGFNDDRGNLFFKISDIIIHHRPLYIILENVRNLATHDDGNTWKVIKSKIDEMGYFTYKKPLILNSLQFGVPQSRERIVILCKRKDIGELPAFTVPEKIDCDLSEILEQNPDVKYKIKGKLKIAEKVWNNFLDLEIHVPKFPIWTDWWDSDGLGTSIAKHDKKKSTKDNELIVKKKQEEFYEKYKKWIDNNRKFYHENYLQLSQWLHESRKNTEWTGAMRKMEWQAGDDILNMNQVLWSPRGSGVRIKKPDYCPTLVAMTSMIPVYGPDSRTLTPRECARLQSFPDEFIMHSCDKIAYKHFGNAVNVKVIEACARLLID